MSRFFTISNPFQSTLVAIYQIAMISLRDDLVKCSVSQFSKVRQWITFDQVLQPVFLIWMEKEQARKLGVDAIDI